MQYYVDIRPSKNGVNYIFNPNLIRFYDIAKIRLMCLFGQNGPLDNTYRLHFKSAGTVRYLYLNSTSLVYVSKNANGISSIKLQVFNPDQMDFVDVNEICYAQLQITGHEEN